MPSGTLYKYYEDPCTLACDLALEVQEQGETVQILGVSLTEDYTETSQKTILATYQNSPEIQQTIYNWPRHHITQYAAFSDDMVYCLTRRYDGGTKWFLERSNRMNGASLCCDISDYLLEDRPIALGYLLSDNLAVLTQDSVFIFDTIGEIRAILKHKGINTSLCYDNNGNLLVSNVNDKGLQIYTIDAYTFTSTTVLIFSQDFTDYSLLGSNVPTYAFFLMRNDTLIGVDLDSGELTELLNWNVLGLDPTSLDTLISRNDGTFLAASLQETSGQCGFIKIVPIG